MAPKGRKMNDEERKQYKMMKKAAGKDPISAFRFISRVEVFEELPFEADENFADYTAGSYQKRREILKKSAVVREKWSDIEFFRAEHRKMLQKKAMDPELRDFLRCTPLIGDLLGLAQRILGQRALISQERNEDLQKGRYEVVYKVPDSVVGTFQKHNPPKRRIQITPNLSLNKLEVVPVYSDIPDEKIDEIDIPGTLLFDYIDQNIINKFAEINLARAVHLAESDPQNTIRCDCHEKKNPSSPIVNCFENPNCPCYKLNEAMKKLQNTRAGRTSSKIGTFMPILLSEPIDAFHEHIGFACSELCGCDGKCTNNALLIPNKHVFPIEMYRNDEKIGFSIRSQTVIPAGTPFLEFVGEIVEQVNLDENSVDYAFEIACRDDQLWIDLVKGMKFSDQYTKLLQCLTKEKFFIDPKIYGNAGRTAAHSCSSNTDMIRVYQKSLSPAHVHLVMVAVTNIFPGVPITIDYGRTYVEKNFGKSGCLCGSIICKNNPDYDEFYSKMNWTDLTDFFSRVHGVQMQCWNDAINEHDKKKRKSIEQNAERYTPPPDIIDLD